VVWFTATDLTTFRGKIERISSDGNIKEFPLSTPDVSPGGVFKGPDGNLWFTDGMNIGTITSSGTVTEFPVPFTDAPLHASNYISAITSAPDGNLWFVESDGVVGRMIPTGEVTESNLLRKNFLPYYFYNAIVAGPGRSVSILAINRIIRIVV
jgi:virginiamycin B lyase